MGSTEYYDSDYEVSLYIKAKTMDKKSHQKILQTQVVSNYANAKTDFWPVNRRSN